MENHPNSVTLSYKDAHKIHRLITKVSKDDVMFRFPGTRDVLIQRVTPEQGVTSDLSFQLCVRIRLVPLHSNTFSYFSLNQAQQKKQTLVRASGFDINVSEMLFFLENHFGVSIDLLTSEQIRELVGGVEVVCQ